MGAKIATTEPYREDDTPDEGYTGCGHTLIATDICTKQSSRKTKFSENWMGSSCSTFVADLLPRIYLEMHNPEMHNPEIHNLEIHSEADAFPNLKFLSSISEKLQGQQRKQLT